MFDFAHERVSKESTELSIALARSLSFTFSTKVIHYNFIPHKILIGKVKKAHFSFSAFCDMISLQYGCSNYKKKARNAVWQGQSVSLSEFLLKVVSTIIFHSLRHLPLSYVFIVAVNKCFYIFCIPCFSDVGKYCNKIM